jgi:hypothetical protein
MCGHFAKVVTKQHVLNQYTRYTRAYLPAQVCMVAVKKNKHFVVSPVL